MTTSSAVRVYVRDERACDQLAHFAAFMQGPGVKHLGRRTTTVPAGGLPDTLLLRIITAEHGRGLIVPINLTFEGVAYTLSACVLYHATGLVRGSAGTYHDPGLPLQPVHRVAFAQGITPLFGMMTPMPSGWPATMTGLKNVPNLLEAASTLPSAYQLMRAVVVICDVNRVRPAARS